MQITGTETGQVSYGRPHRFRVTYEELVEGSHLGLESVLAMFAYIRFLSCGSGTR